MSVDTLLAVDGAVPADDGTVAHYGNPLSEQRRLERGARVLLARQVVRLRGADRLRWLDSITSQAIAALSPGESAETLVLSPEGRIEHALRLVDDGEALWAIVDGRGDELAAWLTRMRFWNDVEIDVVDADVVGWTAGAQVEGVASWRDPWPNVQPGGVRYGGEVGPWDWHETIVTSGLDDVAAGPLAGSLALEAQRIAAGRPSMREVDDRTIPHEVDWLTTAVHLEKGCYRGQETVAKVHNLGSPPRRLTLLHLDGSESQLPEPGDVVETDAGDAAGVITSAAHHADDGPIALALLRRSVPVEAPLVVTSGEPPVRVAASQEVLVPPGAGHAHRPPRLPRLGAVRRPSA